MKGTLIMIFLLTLVSFGNGTKTKSLAELNSNNELITKIHKNTVIMFEDIEDTNSKTYLKLKREIENGDKTSLLKVRILRNRVNNFRFALL